MLKQEITYEDFNGDQVTETFYFNITKSEMVELEAEHNEGMFEYLTSIAKSNDRKTLLAEFKKIVLLAYGQKSPDGRSFIKNDQMREEFSQTAAYNELFMKLVIDDQFAANFVIGIMPKDLAAEVKKSSEYKKLVAEPDKPVETENTEAATTVN